MKIKSINILNFRNYKEIFVEPNMLNVLIGNNAQGKSNFLEAIYYLGNGFSYRTNQNKEIIKWEEEYFRVNADCENFNGEFQISSYLSESKKKIKIDSTEIKKMSQLFGNLYVCIFEPNDLMLVKGNPSLRRTFLNRELVILYPSYYGVLNKFNKINFQRNIILKNMRNNKKNNINIEEWDQIYLELAYKIVVKRIDFLMRLKPSIEEYLNKISKGKEEIELIYKIKELRDIKDNYIPSFDEYSKRFNELKSEEICRGNSVMGPQRDDFTVLINNYDVKSFGSQGQQRTISLCVKLAHLEVIKKEIGEYPILLLDDVMSELDKGRRNILTESIYKKMQIFITATDLSLVEGLDEDSNIYKIENGFFAREGR